MGNVIQSRSNFCCAPFISNLLVESYGSPRFNIITGMGTNVKDDFMACYSLGGYMYKTIPIEKISTSKLC